MSGQPAEDLLGLKRGPTLTEKPTRRGPTKMRGTPITAKPTAHLGLSCGHLARAAGLVLAPLAAAPSGATAQEVRVLSVGEPAATYGEGLGSLRGVRELPDGRVLVADGLGQVLIVWHPDGRADSLANTGQGPDEYRVPDGLFALPGGSTLLVDIGNTRLTEIGPDLAFGETTPIAQSPPGPGMTLVIPTAVDARGLIYFERRGRQMGGATIDSATIARFDRATGSVEELGRVKLEDQERSESGGAGSRNVQIRSRPLTARDAWSAAPDGSVAIARSREYRLEWRKPDGRIVVGPPVAYRPVRVERADKEEWVEQLASSGLGVMMMSDGGPPRMTIRRGGVGGGASVDDYEWPDVKPAFTSGAVRVDPSGRAWVERHGPAGDPTLFDVFDGSGRRVGQVRLPEGRWLVGFGDGTLYLSRTDDLDFQWLERYPLPRL